MWQHELSRGWLQARNAQAPTRVLVETSDAVAAISDFSAFRDAGIRVSVCSGPERAAEECPQLRGTPCPLAERADVVLVDLDTSLRSTQRVVEALATDHPGTPIVVAVPRQGSDDVAWLPERAIRLPMPASVNEQIRAVRLAAIDGRRALAPRA